MKLERRAAHNILFRACTPSQLVEAISALQVKVPPRHLGRETWQAEQWAVHKLLKALPLHRYRFPVTLSRSERPDFMLAMDGITIGIEHTEAVSHVEAKIDFEQGKLAEETGISPPPRMVDAREPNDPRIGKEEAQTHTGNGTPFVGDEMQQNWLTAMSHFITAKADKFASYQSCDRRAVLVYDNWTLPGLEVTECAELLQRWLMTSGVFSKVDEVFVLRHDSLMDATVTGIQIIHV